jgi:hypothetical protein
MRCVLRTCVQISASAIAVRPDRWVGSASVKLPGDLWPGAEHMIRKAKSADTPAGKSQEKSFAMASSLIERT